MLRSDPEMGVLRMSCFYSEGFSKGSDIRKPQEQGDQHKTQTQLARAHPERQVDPHSEFHLLWRREDTVIVNYVHICLFHLRF